MGKQVIILHGWRNRRVEGHWQRLTAEALRKQGHQVYYPQLPSTDEPTFKDWAEVVLTEIALAKEANQGEELIFIGHSLGAVTWLRLTELGLIPTPASRALLVAPADPDLLLDIADFVVNPSKVALEALANEVVLVGSDDDVWSPNGIETTYAEPLGKPAVVIEGAKHFAVLDGWGAWAGVVNWVNDPSSDLRVR
ncbi:MAG: RBBP9/YdeN family alpha/beta hydrolase [Micrococcales bacterium]